METILGTPLYMAPELFNEDTYNFKVDVWAIGVIVFELLTGEHPFKAKTYDDFKNKIYKGSYKIDGSAANISLECL